MLSTTNTLKYTFKYICVYIYTISKIANFKWKQEYNLQSKDCDQSERNTIYWQNRKFSKNESNPQAVCPYQQQLQNTQGQDWYDLNKKCINL
jgi:hypothetical protein